jgi:hypothetical protein
MQIPISDLQACIMLRLVLLSATAGLLTTEAAFSRQGYTVHIEQGELQGTFLASSNGLIFAAFQGIPYAQPPVGKLRFKVSSRICERHTASLYQRLNQGPCHKDVWDSTGIPHICFVLGTSRLCQRGIRGFPRFLHKHAGLVPYIRQWQLPDRSYPILYSLIPPFDATYSVLTVSLHK